MTVDGVPDFGWPRKNAAPSNPTTRTVATPTAAQRQRLFMVIDGPAGGVATTAVLSGAAPDRLKSALNSTRVGVSSGELERSLNDDGSLSVMALRWSHPRPVLSNRRWTLSAWAERQHATPATGAQLAHQLLHLSELLEEAIDVLQ